MAVRVLCTVKVAVLKRLRDGRGWRLRARLERGHAAAAAAAAATAAAGVAAVSAPVGSRLRRSSPVGRDLG
jgi:hypothetical protein